MRDGSGDNKSRREVIREVVRICRNNNGGIRLKRNVGEHSSRQTLKTLKKADDTMGEMGTG